MTGQPIWRERLQGVGVITTEEAVALGATGPILRSTGYAWDLRRDMPYLAYDQVDFDVVVGTYGDCFDRYAIRLNEIRESMRIVRQILDRMPDGRLPRPGQEGHAAAAGPHRRVDGGAHPPLQDLHRGLQGARGRGLRGRRVAPGRARLLPRLRRLGQAVPHAHPRPELRQPPDAAAHDARRPHRRRASPSSPRSTRSWARSTGDGRRADRAHRRNVEIAREIIGRYPRPEVGAHPAAAPGAGAGRLGHRRRHGAHRRAGRRHPGRGARHVLVLRDVQARAGRARTWSTSAPTSPACCSAARSCSQHAEETLGVKAGGTTDDGLFTLEDVECIAACTEAPCLQVNYRYRHRDHPRRVRPRWSTTCGPAGSTTRSRPTARSARVRQHIPGRSGRRRRRCPTGGTEPVWIASRPAPPPPKDDGS